MDALFQFTAEHVLAFLLVTTRISGLVLAAPLLGARCSPFYIRVMLVVSLALLLTPLCADWSPIDMAGPKNVLPALVREAVLGGVLGLSLVVLISAAQSGGRIVGQMSGMSLAESVDAGAGSAGPLFGRLFDLTAAVTFVLMGGHRQVISALLDSFRWVPPGSVRSSDDMVGLLLEVVGESFALSFRIAAPVIAALLLACLAVGLMNRMLPQLNMFSVSFSLNVLVALAVVSVSLGSATWLFQEQAGQAIEAFRRTLAAVAAGNG